MVYTQVVAPDPLIQTMYDLCGNKAAYEALPAFHFSLFRHEVKKLEWEKIPCPFIRVIHEDGRPGLMVKAISKGKKTLFIFLEKASPADYQSKPFWHIISQAFMHVSINKHLMFSNNDQSIFLAAKPLLLQRI